MTQVWAWKPQPVGWVSSSAPVIATVITVIVLIRAIIYWTLTICQALCRGWEGAHRLLKKMGM